MKNLKPIYYLLSILLTICIIIFSYKNLYLPYRGSSDIAKLGDNVKFNSILKNDSDIVKLRIKNAKEGTILETTDINKINEFIQLFKSISFKKQKDQAPPNGYSYSVELIEVGTKNDSLLIEFPKVYFKRLSSGNSSSSAFYSMDNSELVMKKLDTLYNSLKN
jgi:hypothetical protein